MLSEPLLCVEIIDPFKYVFYSIQFFIISILFNYREFVNLIGNEKLGEAFRIMEGFKEDEVKVSSIKSILLYNVDCKLYKRKIATFFYLILLKIWPNFSVIQVVKFLGKFSKIKIYMKRW